MEYCPAHGTDEQRGHEFDDSFYRLQGLDAVLDSSEAVSRRQDVGTRVGVFRDGRLIGYPVNTADPYADDGAYALRDWLAAVNRVDRGLYEVLRGCPNHPDVPIVDCTDCVYRLWTGKTEAPGMHPGPQLRRFPKRLWPPVEIPSNEHHHRLGG